MGSVLYHGSAYRAVALLPSLYHTGEHRRWDDTESNDFLYATTSFRLASVMGFAGVFRVLDLETHRVRFDSGSGVVEIMLSGGRNGEARDRLLHADPEWYVYTLRWDQRWARVDNQRNGARNEFKRAQPVMADGILRRRPMRLSMFLRRHRVLLGDQWIG